MKKKQDKQQKRSILFLLGCFCTLLLIVGISWFVISRQSNGGQTAVAPAGDLSAFATSTAANGQMTAETEPSPKTSAATPQPEAVTETGQQPTQGVSVTTTKEEPPTEQKTKTVIIQIIGPAEKSAILDATEVVWQEDDTVFRVLQRITKEKKIPMSFSGRGAACYVEGIDNIFEFDYGSGSGWLYRVNGVFQSKGAASVEVAPQDSIVWVYTKNMGQDVGITLP